MPRLRDSRGVVVNVDDTTAKSLGSDWKPVKAEAKSTPAKKAEKPSPKK